MIMDVSTAVFLVILVAGFIYARQANSTASQRRQQKAAAPEIIRTKKVHKKDREGEEWNEDESEGEEEPDSVTETVRTARRNVTVDMIEIVQTMAPDLHPDQIRLSLETTGTIEATIDAYLSGAKFPFPGDAAPAEEELQE